MTQLAIKSGGARNDLALRTVLVNSRLAWNCAMRPWLSIPLYVVEGS